MSQEDLSLSQKVAIIIAFTDFKDEEYFVPKEILEKAGVEVITVSNYKGIAQGINGGQISISISLDELKVEDYNGIVFIGGPGCLKNLDNQISYQIAQEAVRQNKILAAICISPVILAKSGVLRNKKATVWSNTLDRSPVKILQENGTIYQDENVVIDGKIITANRPAAADKFAQTIIQAF